MPLIANKIKGKAAVLFDSGVRNGLDIIRALALGADFVLLGRAFMFGVAAFGNDGGDHVAEILMTEMKNDMAQIGVQTIEEIKTLKPKGYLYDTV